MEEKVARVLHLRDVVKRIGTEYYRAELARVAKKPRALAYMGLDDSPVVLQAVVENLNTPEKTVSAIGKWVISTRDGKYDDVAIAITRRLAATDEAISGIFAAYGEGPVKSAARDALIKRVNAQKRERAGNSAREVGLPFGAFLR